MAGAVALPPAGRPPLYNAAAAAAAAAAGTHLVIVALQDALQLGDALLG